MCHPSSMSCMMIFLRLCTALKGVHHHQRLRRDSTPSTGHKWIGILNHLIWQWNGCHQVRDMLGEQSSRKITEDQQCLEDLQLRGSQMEQQREHHQQSVKRMFKHHWLKKHQLQVPSNLQLRQHLQQVQVQVQLLQGSPTGVQEVWHPRG